MPKDLKVYYQNVRGLRSKTNEVLQAVSCADYDIIIFTETWLRNGVFNHEIFDKRYQVFRRDRGEFSSNKSDGGGVLIAAKKSLKISHNTEWNNRSTEDVWITFKENHSKKIHIGCVYLAGSIPIEFVESFTENVISIVSSNPDDQFILIGDFNTPSFASSQNLSARAKILHGMCDLCNFEQCSDIRSDKNSNNLLDLVFSSMKVETKRCEDPLTKADDYHPPFTFALKSSEATKCSEPIFFRNFK